MVCYRKLEERLRYIRVGYVMMGAIYCTGYRYISLCAFRITYARRAPGTLTGSRARGTHLLLLGVKVHPISVSKKRCCSNLMGAERGRNRQVDKWRPGDATTFRSAMYCLGYGARSYGTT